MDAVRESWTDPRLDDMNHRMAAGFNRVDEDLRGLRAKMNTRFDSLQRTLFQLGGGMIAALIGLIATQL